MQRPFIILSVLLGIVIFFLITSGKINFPEKLALTHPENSTTVRENLGGLVDKIHPLSIENLRKGEYPGSEVIVEQELSPGSNYSRFIVSYRSEGLKQFALLTVPNAIKPDTGWPVVIFNHGYIPPSEYRTTERYVAYVDGFASNGYIVFRPDYRGHGNSEGTASGGYGSNDYTIDVLNALSSIKKYKDADPERIGMWGHSMGGFITLRSMVVSPDIKAGVIWGGVVASYPDLITSWRRGNRQPNLTPRPTNTRRWRDVLTQEFGQPSNEDPFWQSISANFFLKDISGPVQLHHSEGDASVPFEFSQTFEKQMKEAGKEVEYFQYPGDDHDISGNFGVAMQRSVEFFDKHLK